MRVGIVLVVLFALAFGFFTLLFWSIAALIGLAGPPRGAAEVALPLGILILVLGVLTLSLGMRGLRSVAMPLGDLVEAAGQIAAGDFSVRVSERGPQGLRALVGAFNSMAMRLETDQEQRRNLLADVTHELRTPLTIVQGNLEGIVDGLYPADPAHLEPILEETRVLSRLIEDLRTLALAESGALELKKEPTDLATLIGETVASFGPQAEAAGIRLHCECAADLPLITIDPSRIRQVLVNLIGNAVRYTPHGGSVEVRCFLEMNSSKRVVISVHDTGPGIPANDLTHVFDRFYKSRDSGGTGLGLTIAKNLVAAHGGGIQVASAEGKGSTFIVHLPSEDS